MKECEICGGRVKKVEVGTRCGHRLWLCEDCKAACPGALRECLECEDREHKEDEDAE